MRNTFYIILLCTITFSHRCVAQGSEGESDKLEQGLLLTSVDKRALPDVITELAQTGDQKLVPLFYALYAELDSKESTSHMEPSPLKKALLNGIIDVGGKNAQVTGKRIIQSYIDLDKGYVKKTGLPFVRQSGKLNLIAEFIYTSSTFFRRYAEIIEPSQTDWALSIAEDETVSYYHARQAAFYCYLAASTKTLKSLEEKVEFVLSGVTSPGLELWDSRYKFIDDSKPIYMIQMPKTWAIKDSQRCKFLKNSGPDALPLIEKTWDELMKKEPKSDADYRRQYALASVMNTLIRVHKIDKALFPHGPAKETKEALKKKEEEFIKARRAFKEKKKQ